MIDFRLLRGGSWINLPRNRRSALRFHNRPDYAFINVGFRVVCRPQDDNHTIQLEGQAND